MTIVSFPNTGPQMMYPDHCIQVGALRWCDPLRGARTVGLFAPWSTCWGGALSRVQGSDGAALIDGLAKKPTDILVSTGMDPRMDAGMCARGLKTAGSVHQSRRSLFVTGSFFAEGPSGHVSYLKQILSDQKVDQLFFAGLATDKSVLFSALDAALLLPDTDVYVIEDACRGTNPASVSEAMRKVRYAGGPACVRLTSYSNCSLHVITT